MTKIVTFYFPQFYPIKENDVWWGKDFTDWKLVKSAKENFKSHYIPRIPLSGYYDQSDPKTIIDQGKLAGSYGIDAFCFYHYWFDGKLMLEKPAENFLKNSEINLEFFFCWANESWTKAWIGQPDKVLLKQNHEKNIEGWENHFNYLLPFFKDPRYIRKNNKPVFVIYQPDIIDNSLEMFNYWQILARKNGFDGIYLIGIKHFKKFAEDKGYSAFLRFQPREAFNSGKISLKNLFYQILLKFFPDKLSESALNKLRKIKRIFTKYDYIDSDLIWQSILETAEKDKTAENKIFQSAFVNWDNTARYGNKAKIFSFIQPAEFGKYLEQLWKICKNDDFLFINAWNEWSECAYLEPDMKYKYEYLEEIKKIKERIPPHSGTF